MDFSLEDAKGVLRQTPHTLQAMLSPLPATWTAAAEAPGAWSPYQVVGHLTHVEEDDWIGRATLILARGRDGVFQPLDREAGSTRYQGWALGQLLDRFASLRSSNLQALGALVDAEDLGRLGVHPSLGEVTLAQLLATWVVHDLNHLHQIVKTLATHYTQAVGPWRGLLDVLDEP